MCLYLHVCVCVCIYIYIYVCIYMYVYLYACECTYTFIFCTSISIFISLLYYLCTIFIINKINRPTRRQRALWTMSQERSLRFLADRQVIGAVERMKSPACHTWRRRFDDRSPWSDQWLVCPMHQTFRWPPARNQRHRWYLDTDTCDTFLSLRLPQQSRLNRCMLSRDTSQKRLG